MERGKFCQSDLLKIPLNNKVLPPSVTAMIMPSSKAPVPRVATKAFTPSPVTIMPLNKPIRSPAVRPATIARAIRPLDAPFSTIEPATTPPNPIAPAIDKSKSPTMRQIVSPPATMPKRAALLNTICKLSQVKTLVSETKKRESQRARQPMAQLALCP